MADYRIEGYKVRLVAGRYCLAETENNWIVGCGYDSEAPEYQQWGQGIYIPKGDALHSLLGLNRATEYIIGQLNENYISRDRLIELATRFKDCAVGDEDFEYERDDMTESEREFFGLNEMEDNL